MKLYLSILLILFINLISSQEKKIIQIIEAGSFERNEKKIPGANILKKNDKIRVHLLHDGMDIWSDYALFFKKNNSFRANGNVVIKQGDSIKLYSDKLNYDGNLREIIAEGNVDFYNNNTNLKTEILFYDRDLKEIFFQKGGVIKDSLTIIKSIEGRYYLENLKYTFVNEVEIQNPDYTINSNKIQ